ANRGEPAPRGCTRPRLNRLRRFLPRLAQVCVQIDEAWRNDQARSIKHLRAGGRAKATRLRDLNNFFSLDEDVARRVRIRRRIDHAPVLNQKHWRIPWVLLRAPDACRFLKRPRSADKGWPCVLPRHSLPAPGRMTAARPQQRV